jgi:hypothetical protein
MTDLQFIFGILAGFFSLVCFVPYIVTILQKKTKPNRASWWIWATNGLVLCIGNYAAGANNTIWALICAVIAQTFIAILSIKYGQGGWNRFDRRCLFGSGISFILWRVFNSPLIAILLPLVIDILAALPTLKKSYYEPESEDVLTWILYTIGSLLNIFAITTWSFAIIITPLYVLGINTAIVLLLLRHKIQSSLSLNKMM